MRREDLRRLFARARDLCGETDYDREWIRPGLEAGVLSWPIIAARFAETTFLDARESARAREALEEDRGWLARMRRRRRR